MAGVVTVRLSRQRIAQMFPVVLAAVAIIVLPQLTDGYIIFVAALAGAFFVGASALVVLMGHAHQFHLGFAGVMALGAYTSVVSQNEGLPMGLSLLAAMVAGGLIHLLLGYVSRWFGQFAVAIVTFGFGVFVLQGIRHFEDITGGNVGLAAPRVSLPALYWLAWISAALAALVFSFLLRGWVGRSFRALRDGPVPAELFGLPIPRVKVMAFAVTGPFVGLSGALYAHLIGYISPNTFSLTLSLAFVVIIIIGGATYLWGALIGSLLWVVTPELTASVTGLFPIVLGTVAILTLMWAPSGVVGVLTAVGSAMRNRLAAGDGLAPSERSMQSPKGPEADPRAEQSKTRNDDGGESSQQSLQQGGGS